MTNVIADFTGFITSTIGLVSWTVLAFVVGAFFGASVWAWFKTKLPWTK